MSDWNYIDDEKLRRVIDALNPFFTGGHQLSLVQLADIIAEIGYNEATLDLDELEAFRETLISSAGAAAVGSADGNVQSDIDDLDSRLTEMETGTVHADVANINGDGSDVTADMQSFLNSAAGKTVVLGPDRIYGITSIDIPAGTTLVSNGSKFTKLAASSTPGITCLGAIEADVLWLDTVGGASDAGVYFEGSNVAVGKVKVDCAAADSGSAGGVYAVLAYSGGVTTIENVRIGTVEVTDHAYPFKTINVDDIEVGMVDVTNYRRGYDCVDTKNGVFYRGHLAGTSPSATGASGENAVLVTSTSDAASENLRFERWIGADAAEITFSVAGTHRVRNVHFNRCKSSNSGAGGATAVSGSALKVVGNPATSTYHEDIYVDDLLIEDCGTAGAGTDAFSAVQIGMVRGGEFRFRVRAEDNANSAKNGFSVWSCEDVHIYPEVKDAATNAGRFIAVATYPTTMTDVIVHGGKLNINNAAENVVVFDCQDNTFDNVSIADGCILTGGVSGTEHVAPTTGSYTNCSVDIKRIRAQTTTGDPPTVNSNDILVKLVGPLYGTSHTQGSNGSQVTDTSTGDFKIRKAGVWTTL